MVTMFSIKDLFKLIVISIISFCAVFVSNLFLNFYLDLGQLDLVGYPSIVQTYYDAQVSISWLVSSISGAVLSLTSALLLFFYIGQFIDRHKEEMGILKALGYKNIEIARKFWIFSLPVGLGTAGGYFSSFLMMPHFYRLRNNGGVLPKIIIEQHWILFFYLVLLPVLIFSGLAICYAAYCLRSSALNLLRRSPESKRRKKKEKRANRKAKMISKERPFLKDLSYSLLWSRKVLILFVIFGAMCFSAMIQLSFSMRDLMDETLQFMMMGIGIVLSLSILYLSLSILLQENQETLALMKVFGYSRKECRRSLFLPYTLLAFLGFVLGSAYQYGLMQLLMKMIEKTLPTGFEYSFDWVLVAYSFLGFLVVYQGIIYLVTRRMDRLNLKKMMGT